MTSPRGASSTSGKVRIVVTDTIEYEVDIDTADPRWKHLAEDSNDPDEWVAALDEEASQPDTDLAALVKKMTPTDAYREVTHAC